VQGNGAVFEERGRSHGAGVRGLFRPSNTIAITRPAISTIALPKYFGCRRAD